MGWSFRESIKILPGVRLSFSRKGVSASVGTKGLHLGVGGGRAPRVTGSMGPLRYYQSMGNSHQRRLPRYRAPSAKRLLVGAGLSVCLLLGLLWVPPRWWTTHLQAAAPQLFPASWAAGYTAPSAESPQIHPNPAPIKHHHSKSSNGESGSTSRREPGR